MLRFSINHIDGIGSTRKWEKKDCLHEVLRIAHMLPTAVPAGEPLHLHIMFVLGEQGFADDLGREINRLLAGRKLASCPVGIGDYMEARFGTAGLVLNLEYFIGTNQQLLRVEGLVNP